MNAKKRIRLKTALEMLSGAVAIISVVSDQEQDAFDNYPENLQDTEACEAMERAVENLNEAIEKIEEAKECIEAAAE